MKNFCIGSHTKARRHKGHKDEAGNWRQGLGTREWGIGSDVRGICRSFYAIISFLILFLMPLTGIAA